MEEAEHLSKRELIILNSIPSATDVEELAKLTKVAPATLGMDIARLQIRGFIAEDGSLTEKGLQAIRK
jgi:hypothetical protein